MTRRLLFLLSGLTLLSAVVETSYSEQGCRGCDIRTAVVINRALLPQAESGSANSLQERQIDPIQIDQIMEKYKQEKERGDWIRNAALLGGIVVDEVVSKIGDVISPLSGVPSIVVSGGEILARFTTAKALLHFTGKMDESASVMLADRLKQYRQQHNGNFSGLLDAYDRGKIPDADAFEFLFGKHPVYDTRLGDVRPEDQYVVNKFIIQSLADTLREGMAGINNLLDQHDAAIAANQVDIAKNRRNLTLMAQAFNRYADEANKRFTRLEADQRKLRDAVFENRESIQILLFDTLTPKQQLKALEDGFFPSMSGAKREELKHNIQFQKTLEDVIWISRGVGELAVIARNLGVDEEITEPVAVAVEIGVSAVVAIALFETGQIYQGIAVSLGGISTLTGLLGEDEPDPVIENQKKIFEALRSVMGGLEHIDRKLDRLFENQQMVMANQRKIYDLMLEIGEDIQAKHAELLISLYELGADVLYNRELIRQRVSENLADCDAMRRGYAHEGAYGTDTPDLEGYLKHGVFPDYQNIGRISRNHRLAQNGPCHEQLQTVFAHSSRPLHSYFQLRTYQREPVDSTSDGSVDVGRIGNFLELIYNPSLRLIEDHNLSGFLSHQQILSTLFWPVADLQALDHKYDHAQKFQPHEQHMLVALQNALSPTAVLSQVWLLLDIYPLFQFVNPEGTLYPLDELTRLATSTDGLRTFYGPWLKQALDIVDIAIAQQTLLAGDVLLPILYEKLHRVSSTRAQEQLQSTRLLLQKNPLLARNFMLYLVHRQLNGKIPVLAYDTAILENNITDHQKRFVANILKTLYSPSGDRALSLSDSDWSTIDKWLEVQMRPIQQQIQSIRQPLNELDRLDIRARSERSDELYASGREDQHEKSLGIRAYLIDDQFHKRIEELNIAWHETDPRDLSGIYNVDLSRVIFNMLMTHKDNNMLRTLLINQWLQEQYHRVHQIVGGEAQYEFLLSRMKLEKNYPFRDERPALEPESEACQRPEGSLAPLHRPHARFFLTEPTWLNPDYDFPPVPSFVCDEEHYYPHCASCFLFYSGEIDNRLADILGSAYADGDNLRSRWRRRLLTNVETLKGDVHNRLFGQLDAWLGEEESIEGVHVALSHDGAGVWVSEPEPRASRRFERHVEFMSHDGMKARVKALTDEGLWQGDKGLLQIDAWLKEQYHLALADDDEHILRLILDESVHYAELVRRFFEQDGSRVEKWAIKWGDDLYLPLPEADDFIEGKFFHTRYMSKLIELRSYIIEEIIGRRFVGNENGLLGDSEHQLFNDLLLLHATESSQGLSP